MKNEEAIQGEDILVFAPHNDDEILGVGGVLQRYIESGSRVRIVVMTNGDGQVRRPSFLPFFRADFVKLGYRRQEESLEALDYLGLGEEDVEFLGYPDRGLSYMWTNHWDWGDLYYSKYTKTDRSPYDNSYTENAPYCGLAVIEDIKRLLSEVQPDVVYLPHPNDSHPDHWATNGLVLYGLEELKNETAGDLEEVSLLNYLVHSLKFPFPRGKYLEASLTEPPSLNDLDTDWMEVPLELRERLRKLRAIGKYRTQTQLMRKYLVSFARANELFGIVPSLSLQDSTKYDGNTDLSSDFIMNEEEDEPFLSYLNPKRKSRIATLKRYPDIKAVSLAKSSGVMTLAINFFNRYRPGNAIQVSLKPFVADGTGWGSSHIFNFRRGKFYHNGAEVNGEDGYAYESGSKSYKFSVPLAEIGRPEKLILSITLARKGVPFARSANRLVEIE